MQAASLRIVKKSHSNLFKLNKSRVGYMTAQHQVSADNII